MPRVLFPFTFANVGQFRICMIGNLPQCNGSIKWYFGYFPFQKGIYFLFLDFDIVNTKTLSGADL